MVTTNYKIIDTQDFNLRKQDLNSPKIGVRNSVPKDDIAVVPTGEELGCLRMGGDSPGFLVVAHHQPPHLPVLDLVRRPRQGEKHLHDRVGCRTNIEVIFPHTVLALEVALHNSSHSSVLLRKSCSNSDEIVSGVKDDESPVRDSSRHKRSVVHDTNIGDRTSVCSFQHPDHLDRAPHHQVALGISRYDFARIGECNTDDILRFLDLLREESLPPHQNVPLDAPYVEVALPTGDQDVVSLLIEPDGEDPVGGGGGGGEENGLDLLLLKLAPDRDVWLVSPVNNGELGTTFTGSVD